MYRELIEFDGKVLKSKAIWISGEFITSLIVGGTSFAVFHWIDFEHEIMDTCYEQTGNILTVVSILCGFALTSYLHFIQMADTWCDNEDIQSTGQMLVDWNAFTVICILFLILYMTILMVAYPFVPCTILKEVFYSILNAWIVFCLLQLVCHALNTWFLFRKRYLFRKE